jgi:hypothetical protein
MGERMGTKHGKEVREGVVGVEGISSNHLSLNPGSVVQLLQRWVHISCISFAALFVVYDEATTLTYVSRYPHPVPPELSHPLQQQSVLQKRRGDR